MVYNHGIRTERRAAMKMKRNTAVKYRIYPTEEQKVFFAKNFGCCRFVYNTMLSIQEELYRKNGLHLSKYDAFKMMTSELKSRAAFLKEADSLALMNSVFALSDAYDRYFRKLAGRPVYKTRKRNRDSYTTNNQNGTVSVSDRHIRIPKAGYVRAKVHRTVTDAEIKQATVSRDSDGRYYCSVLYEYMADIPERKALSSDDAIGLDMSERLFYTDSNGNVPQRQKTEDMAKRLKKEQRKLSHMTESHITGYKTVKGNRVPVYDRDLSECRNILKQRKKIARIHRKQADRRKDFLHKESGRITNCCGLICIEDISVRDMMLTGSDEPSAVKRHNINRKAMSNGWNIFTRMLTYKAEIKGGMVIRVPKEFPSSRMCHCCGHVNPEISDIRIRKWTCPECGKEHDRDINAAVNIKNKGWELYKESVA